MCLIFEKYEPFLVLFVISQIDFNGNDYRACIDLIGFLLILKLALFLKTLCGDGSQIHKAGELVGAVCEKILPGLLILLEGLLKCLFVSTVVESNFLNLG